MHHRTMLLVWLALVPAIGTAAGTLAGTDIVNQVEVAWQTGAEAHTGVSNPAVITVAEIIDLNVLVQTPERLVAPGAANQPLYFTVTNTGNGAETFAWLPSSLLPAISLTRCLQLRKLPSIPIVMACLARATQSIFLERMIRCFRRISR